MSIESGWYEIMKTKKPRVIQMNDDSVAYFNYCTSEKPTAKDLEDMVDIFANAGVDTLTHCVHCRWQAYYDSKVVEVAGDLTPEAVKPWQYAHHWHWHACLRRLIADGNDPPKVIAARCHQRGMRFLPSFRLNDTHNIHPHEGQYGSFRRDHPEWKIEATEGAYHYLVKPMNYGVPQVRQHILSVARELTEHYDIDGVDLDFMRWPIFFKSAEVRSNTPVMTDFIREIRSILNEAGKRLNRRMFLSVRVPLKVGEGKVINAFSNAPELECLGIGLDIRTWVKERLIDIVCPMNHFYTDWHHMITNLSEWQKLTKDSQCALHPTIHSTAFNDYLPPYISRASYRGAVYSYYLQGADGIALYNFWDDNQVGWETVRDLGNPDVLSTKPRRYHAYLDGLVVINKGERKTFEFFLPEDPQDADQRAHLRFFGANLTLEHRIEIDINGTKVDSASLTLERVKTGGFKGAPKMPYGHLVSFPLVGTAAKTGKNALGVSLIENNPEIPWLVTYLDVPESKGGIAMGLVEALFGYPQLPSVLRNATVAVFDPRYWRD